MPKEDQLTEFEREFGIRLDSGNLDVKRGVEISLKVERDGFEFYTENARRIQNIDIKRFIEFLAGEERKHIALLEELRESMGTKGAWLEVREEPKTTQKVLEDLRVFKGKAGKEVREAGDVAVVLNAMKTEKDLVEFYEKFANSIEDPEGRKFFLKLADWERTHYQLLEGIHESITFFRMQT